MGFACLADEVHTRFLQRRGWPPVLVPLLSSKQSNQGINIIAMLKHMIICENMMYMVLMCLQFNLIEVYCKGVANSNSKFKFKLCHMHVFYCSPILKWSNMETSCIFIILAFFDNFRHIICPI